jgi:uncharacterized protein (TIGR00159 family)
MFILTSQISFLGVQLSIRSIIDIGLVIALIYMVLLISGGRRIVSLQGLCLLIFLQIITEHLGLENLSYLLAKLVLAGAVAIAINMQSELIRLLELLGRGRIKQLFQKSNLPPVNNKIEELVEAVKDLSQNRIGALIVLELNEPIDLPTLINPGVTLNADISKELILTIFRQKTPLHDGAVLIRESKIISAAVILPLSEKSISRQLGTRHRAAIGITEKKNDCICIVVSEETGSISLVEKGNIDRPLTGSRLKELLQERFFTEGQKETVSLSFKQLGLQFWWRIKRTLSRLFPLFHSNSNKKRNER